MNTEDQLGRALREQASQVGTAHPVSLADVKGRAGSIRRRRYGVAAGALCAAVAIAAPVIVLNTQGNSTNPQPPVATSTPTNEPTQASPEPTNLPLEVTVTLNDLPVGAGPAIDWIQRNTLHLAGGDTVRLPSKDYSDVVAYHGGWLAIRADRDGDDSSGGAVLDTIDASGTVTKTVASSWGFARSADLLQLAWVEEDEIVSGIASGMGEGEKRVRAEGPEPDLAGFTPDGEVVYSINGEHTKVFRTDFETTTEIEGARSAAGVSTAGLASLVTEVDDEGNTCSEVRDLNPGGIQQWYTCNDYRPTKFSADGSYVLGLPSYGSGFGSTSIAILDAETGEPVRVFNAIRDGAIVDAQWDGEANAVIAQMWDEGKWQLVRLGVDGQVESASEPIPIKDPFDGDLPLHLTSRP